LNGYETPGLVRAALEALERERRGHIRDQRHLAEIERQEELFLAELKRLLEAGQDEPVDEGRGKGRSTLIRNSTTGRTYQEWIN
jgi:hypothetical protein